MKLGLIIRILDIILLLVRSIENSLYCYLEKWIMIFYIKIILEVFIMTKLLCLKNYVLQNST